jgi:hypothetical protein
MENHPKQTKKEEDKDKSGFFFERKNVKKKK